MLALLPGSDPRLPRRSCSTPRTTTTSACARAPPGEDAIYNGAEDNASGVAAMLGVARAYARCPRRRGGRILFAARGRRGAGLLGSEYLARHPPVPLGRIAVDINIDGANIFGRTRDVTVIGLGKIDLDLTLRALARAAGPGAARRTSSPTAATSTAATSSASPGWGSPRRTSRVASTTAAARPAGDEKREAWEETRYHQPSDELTPDWDLSGAVEDARLQFALGYSVAQATPLPAWTKGDEFEAPRLQSLETLRRRPPGATPASGR